MTKVPVERRDRAHGTLVFALGDIEHRIDNALSQTGFMWFEYHWPNGTMERSMEVRQMNIGKQETPEKDGRPKAARYPKFVVFED